MPRRALLPIAVAGALAGSPAQAQGPSFDCAKARGTVQAAICADPALAALDRRLAQVYRAAAAKARGPLATRLREDQRGWIKGRDDCWKADGRETWITATWTVSTVRDCVDAQYRLRTSELQAVWRLLPAATTTYRCGAVPADELVVNRFDTDPPTIRLERGDRTVTLWRVGAPPEGRYEGRNVSLSGADGALAVDWLDTDAGRTDALRCTTR